MNEHPLTDEVIDSNENWGCLCYEGIMYDQSDLRAAADWQLEQVIEWIWKQLEEDKDDNEEDVDFCYYITDNIVDELRAAMRPTNTQENN